MSLNIQTSLQTPEGFVIENAYGRIAVLNNAAGTQLDYNVNLYVSKQAFEAGAQPFYPLGLMLGGSKAYEYSVETANILDIAHDEMIATLAEQGVTAQKSL